MYKYAYVTIEKKIDTRGKFASLKSILLMRSHLRPTMRRSANIHSLFLFPCHSIVKFYCQTVAFTFRNFQMYGNSWSVYSDLCSISSDGISARTYINVYEYKDTRTSSENLKAFAESRDEWQMRLINLKYIRTIQILLNSVMENSHILLRQDINFCLQ